jgi:hypothetical protein
MPWPHPGTPSADGKHGVLTSKPKGVAQHAGRAAAPFPAVLDRGKRALVAGRAGTGMPPAAAQKRLAYIKPDSS